MSATSQVETAVRTGGRFAPRTVMVVDDDDAQRALLGSVLDAHGYSVVECADGEAALEHLRARAHRPDVIVLDLVMPVMDGWQFRVAQKADPAVAGIPVLALSADATSKAAAVDALVYMSKPVDLGSFAATVDRIMVQIEPRELQAELAQASRLTSLGTLAAGIAHEINNPLAFVMLGLESIAKDLPGLATERADPERPGRGERLRETLALVQMGSARIRDAVQGLRTFSRPDLEARGPVDLRAVVDSAITLLSNELRHRARLVRDYPADLPAVLGNEAHLGQVFVNLLLNALQAMPVERRDPPAEVRVSIRAEDQEVVVEVIDTGSGIAPEALGRIFEPFFTTKPVGVGTGLGLAICHGIVTAHGGTITASSEEGRGTRVRVGLPMAPERRPDVPGSPVVGAPPARARLLVVDDEPSFVRSLRPLLEPEHEVETAASAREALELIVSGRRYDVILCDVMMADMDGSELHQALRDEAPSQARRMVFVTGGAFTERTQRFLAEVPNPRLDKPFEIASLLRLLREGVAPR